MHGWNRKIRKFAAGVLDLPQDVILDLPRLTLIGTSRLHVENHRGVIGFSGELLQLRLTGGTLDITGSGLTIRAIMPEEVIVEGTITGIRFSG